MPRPTNKSDLEKQAEENFNKLMELVEEKEAK
jgi:hypothetical protein